MMRLTWLQFRLQAAAALAGLAVVALLVALTGPPLAHVYATVVAPCLARAPGACGPTVAAFVGRDALLQRALNAALLAAPALLGVFWGAPLVARELERGTFRLAWTQSVSRRRWLAVKLGVVGLASAAAAGLLSLMGTWWFGPLDRVHANRFDPAVFDVRGVVPVGYALFAFALGVTAGVLLPRLLPAMATTLALFVGARLAVTTWIRPHLMAPVRHELAFVWGPGAGIAQGGGGSPFFVSPPTPDLPNAWVYANAVVDQAGHPPSSQFLQRTCPALTVGAGDAGSAVGSGHAVASPGAEPTAQEVHACVSAIAAQFHQVVTYQPAGRYWTFQGLETALYVALALLLAWLCFWWVRRRVA
ncbi:MAG TPA: hypothetical protein VFW96_25115 [Thermomicrobiales bacterium]|nr:hypothetical protein [Thermomicrobiales bacterium]